MILEQCCRWNVASTSVRRFKRNIPPTCRNEDRRGYECQRRSWQDDDRREPRLSMCGRGRATLLWDLDPQGAATYMLRCDPNEHAGCICFVVMVAPLHLPACGIAPPPARE